MEASGSESNSSPVNPGPEVQPVDTGIENINSCYQDERGGVGGVGGT